LQNFQVCINALQKEISHHLTPLSPKLPAIPMAA
uniref:Uncharacterized protein n=1 Tax=Aegilops tauschii subsp. strangulata TaxID=200361 RepID=A0A452Z3D6_AEGTS